MKKFNNEELGQAIIQILQTKERMIRYNGDDLNPDYLFGATVINKKNGKKGTVIGYYKDNEKKHNRYKVINQATGKQTDWNEANIDIRNVIL